MLSKSSRYIFNLICIICFFFTVSVIPTIYLISFFSFFILRSVFHRKVRTNNDVEGWHRRLNAKATKGQLNLYALLQLLAEEAALVTVNIRLLKDACTARRQRASSRSVTQQLFQIWDDLVSGRRTPRQTLRKASQLVPIPASRRSVQQRHTCI